MYKMILFVLLSVVFMMLHVLQIDSEIAIHSLFQAKYAVNRSTHAAAQQLDLDKLSYGISSIDSDAATETAKLYLQRNLNLDSSNRPHPNAFLQSHVEILALDVINEEEQYPYEYINSAYNYRVTVFNPSVVMIIRVVYPRTFNMIGPITWEVKGVAELVDI